VRNRGRGALGARRAGAGAGAGAGRNRGGGVGGRGPPLALPLAAAGWDGRLLGRTSAPATTCSAPPPNLPPPCPSPSPCPPPRSYIRTHVADTEHDLPPTSAYHRACPRLAAQMASTVFLGTSYDASTPADVFGARFAAAVLARRPPRCARGAGRAPRRGGGWAAPGAERPRGLPAMSRAARGGKRRPEPRGSPEPAPTPPPAPAPGPAPGPGPRHFRYGAWVWFPWLMSMVAPVRVMDWGFALRFGLIPGAAKRRAKAA
jgi:hypothetical protein